MIKNNKNFYNNSNLILDLNKTSKTSKTFKTSQISQISKRPILVYDKSLIIIKEYLTLKFKLYNGQKFNEIIITEDKIGCRFGEFVITKKKHIYVKKKKK